jgi:hypothetical protein
MPIDPALLARSLGALETLDLEEGLATTLQQALRSAKTLLEADRAGLMLVDHAGALRWASTSDVEAVAGDPERLAQGLDAGDRGALSVPVRLGGGPVGTLDVYVTAPREWDDSEAAALHAYAGLIASVCAAAVTARTTGRLADQLQEALRHRSLIEQAGAVAGGASLPSDRLDQAKAQRREASDLEVAGHRRDSENHEGAARRYERRGQAGRAQTERLQAAAARGRIIDAEAERRRADQQP